LSAGSCLSGGFSPLMIAEEILSITIGVAI
jgi:hypothetical protein